MLLEANMVMKVDLPGIQQEMMVIKFLFIKFKIIFFKF